MDDGHLQLGPLSVRLLHDHGPHVQEGGEFRGRLGPVPVVAKHYVIVGNRGAADVRGLRRQGRCEEDPFTQGFYFV